MKIRQLSKPEPLKPTMLPNGYKGNVDLLNRPMYKNKDGSISTVKSAGFNIDGVEILLPTIGVKNGRPAQLTDDEAISLYKATGKHLGKFKTPEQSNAMAELIHKHQEKYYGK